MQSTRTRILRTLSSIPGWTTRRKIVVFESDDWGSLGTPSAEVFGILRERGIYPDDDAAHYYRYDALETNEDLASLFEVLSSVRDSRGNHPVFTGYNVVANPDFKAIAGNGFSSYHYEPLDTTLEGDPSRDRVLELWKEGVEKRLFIPQFHGREHLNVTAWINALKKGSPLTLEAFRYGVFGIDPVALGESPLQFRAAFDLGDREEIAVHREVIRQGISLFRRLLGYTPVVFVPPNGPFNLALEETLHENGIRYLVLDKLQKEPLGDQRYRTRIRYPGRRNRYGQVYLSRNASFEPSSNRSDWVDGCLAQVEMAFRWKKPATISTHRVNYTGFLDPGNRDGGLKELARLLKSILNRWPGVEFLSTGELGDLVNKKN